MSLLVVRDEKVVKLLEIDVSGLCILTVKISDSFHLSCLIFF